MQASIDPNVGQADLSAMRKDADRMQLQLDGLISKRKQLIAGLESRVDNRKAINTKIEVCKIHPSSLTSDYKYKAYALMNTLVKQ